MRIAVCISTHNRNEVFKKCVSQWEKHGNRDGIDIFVVDDGSVVPIEGVTLRHEKALGIAATKNACLALAEEYDHIFLSDDDFWPIADGWWIPYIESDEPHLCFVFPDFAGPVKLNDTAEFYADSKIRAFSHPRGCLLYFTKECLRAAGGMDTYYGKWGYEHSSLSERIYNMGLTSFQYQDAVGADKLFYSMDEHREVRTTCPGIERRMLIARNKPYSDRQKYSADYFPHRPGAKQYRESHGENNIVLTSYFTGVFDPQRGVKWAPHDWFEEIEPLLRSVVGYEDGRKKPCSDHFVMLQDFIDKDDASLTRVETSINPYFQRWISYRQWLIKNRRNIGKVFCVDATDVVMLNNPFAHVQPGVLYTGCEPGGLDNVWLNHHHKHPLLQNFFKANRKLQLLNAGILGGDVDTIIRFCGLMISHYGQTEADAKFKGTANAGMTDMGLFNYVARTFFKPNFGPHVNTEFKKYDYDNKHPWWRHK